MQEPAFRLHWATALAMGVVLTHVFVRMAFDWWKQDTWKVGHTFVLYGLWGLLAVAVAFIRVDRRLWLRGAYWTSFLVLLAAPLQEHQSAWHSGMFHQVLVLFTMLTLLLLAWLPRWVFSRLLHRQSVFLASPTAATRRKFVRSLLLCLPISGALNLAAGLVVTPVIPTWEIWSAKSSDQRVIAAVEMVAQTISVLLLLGLWVRQIVLRRLQRNAVLYGRE